MRITLTSIGRPRSGLCRPFALDRTHNPVFCLQERATETFALPLGLPASSLRSSGPLRDADNIDLNWSPEVRPLSTFCTRSYSQYRFLSSGTSHRDVCASPRTSCSLSDVERAT